MVQVGTRAQDVDLPEGAIRAPAHSLYFLQQLARPTEGHWPWLLEQSGLPGFQSPFQPVAQECAEGGIEVLKMG